MYATTALNSMKRLIFLCVSLAAFALLLTSCNSFYFSAPQPVDASNLYKFPAKMRGTWLTGSDTVVFETRRVVVYQTERIRDGIVASDPVDTLEKNSALKGNKSLKTRVWSTEKKNYDTISNYIIRGDKIYKVQWDNIAKGASYRRTKDSIDIRTRIEMPLGEGTFLRKINDTVWVANVKVTTTMMESDGNGPWWTLVLIEVPAKDKMYISYPEQNLKKDPSVIGLAGNTYYLDGHWTANEILTKRGVLFETRDDGLKRIK